MADHCRSCGAPIEWALTVKGANMPVDPDDGTAGNIVIDADGVAHVVTDGAGTHRSHFATCPNSAKHRRPNGRRR